MILVAAGGWLGALLAAAGALRLRRRLELVARAEHELRGPVTALALAAEWAGRHSQPPAIEPHLDRLRLGLADLESARSGRRSRPRPQPVDLDWLIGRAAEAFRPVLEDAGRRLELRRAAVPLTVSVDAARLTQALANLLANALEHGHGPVELRARRRPGTVAVEVADAGGGFRPAPRAGRGRGLQVVRDAVEEAGGRVEIGPPGRGSSVLLELPAHEP